MSGVRIKNLRSASPLIEQQFNEMQFIADISTISSFAPRQSSDESDSALGLASVPHPKIKEYANLFGWKIHKIERTISASKTSRRRQEEWITTNY